MEKKKRLNKSLVLFEMTKIGFTLAERVLIYSIIVILLSIAFFSVFILRDLMICLF